MPSYPSAQAPAAASSSKAAPADEQPAALPAVCLPNAPALVVHGRRRFLIMDAPSEGNVHLYLQEMQRQRVSDVVRVCEPTYARETLERAGIRVHDWLFPDGEGPPDTVVQAWLRLIASRFPPDARDDGPCIAIHCVAGLGRAPVLVAIALIEEGMGALDAVLYVRERRRGAINNRQLKFLESYRRQSRPSRCWVV